MPRKTKNPYFYLLLLFLICVTTSFSSIKGWCVDNRNENIDTHIELSDCHSNVSDCDGSALVNVELAHSTDNNKHCTTCLDVTPDILVAKVLDDSLGSLVSPPSSNAISPLQQYSNLKTFATAASNVALATDQSSSRQTLQNKAIRTVVLLI